MDSKQFLKVLSKVIREEVRLAVRAEMRIALLEQGSIAPTPTTKPKPGILSQALGTRKAAPQPVRRFTQVPGALGDILNETAMSMMSHPTSVEEQEWPTVGEEGFTQVPATEDYEPPTPSSNRPHPSGDPTMAFVKDYRAVVKSAEAIHNSKY